MNVQMQLPKRPRVLVIPIFWLTIALALSSQCFSVPKQPPSSASRERAGLALRVKADRTFELSIPETRLLRKLSTASESREWQDVPSLVATYNGTAVPIYTAAMHAAFRCREYQAGATVFEKCQQACSILNAPVYGLAVKIHGKLGNREMVRKIWNQTLRDCDFSDILATARISAAADEGDVETAAEILDLMNKSGVAIDVHHINTALKACWGWNNKMHKAGRYLFDLLPQLGLKPTLISYTNLIGAYRTAKLQDVLAAYRDMKERQISPDTIFAETYLACLLQLKKDVYYTPEKIHEHRLEKPVERFEAAREAFKDFEKEGLRLTHLSSMIRKALKQQPS